MAKIKPQALLQQSKKKKGPSRISITNIVIYSLAVLLVIFVLFSAYRRWTQRSQRTMVDQFLRYEPFDTYPRTYDFLHASRLFSIERKRCEMSTILIEMDRILRPGGRS